MAKHLKHLNGNLLCAIDCETTGLRAGYHDLIQVCVLPLDSNFEPLKDIPPFYMAIKPQRPETMDLGALSVNMLDFKTLMDSACDVFAASERFEAWFNSLNLAFNKKIAPLGHNYPFDKGFMVEWLGHDAYDTYFHYHVRDTVAVAQFLNDRSVFVGEEYPCPKLNLGHLCTRFGVENKYAHDALHDCLATASIYHRMIMRTTAGGFPLQPVKE